MLLAVTLLLVGCQGASRPSDPFVLYGPQRISPPATGSLGQTALPYDQPAASAPATLPPMQSQVPADLQVLPPSGLLPRTGNAPLSNGTGVLSLPPDRWEAPHSAVIPAGGIHPPERQVQNQSLHESDNLRWGQRGQQASIHGVRQASAFSPFAPVPHVPAVGTGVEYRSAATTAGPPQTFVPLGRPVEISQPPVAGYTPNTFDPYVAAAPDGAQTLPSHGVALPADPRANQPIGTGAIVHPPSTPGRGAADSLQWKSGAGS